MQNRRSISFDLDEFKKLLEEESGKDYTCPPWAGKWQVDGQGNIVEIRYDEYGVDGKPIVIKRAKILYGVISDESRVPVSTSNIDRFIAGMRDDFIEEYSQDDWDGDGAFPVKAETFDAAAKWIAKIATASVNKYRRPFLVPSIEPCHSGTINVIWKSGELYASANFSLDGNKEDIYVSSKGDLADWIEGYVENDVKEEDVADFIEKYRGES